MQNFLMIIVCVITMISTATTAKANELAECKKQVETCEKVLDSADGYIMELNDVIRMKNDEIRKYEDLMETYDRLQEERQLANDTWYKSPWIMGALGVMTGVLIAK